MMGARPENKTKQNLRSGNRTSTMRLEYVGIMKHLDGQTWLTLYPKLLILLIEIFKIQPL